MSNATTDPPEPPTGDEIDWKYAFERTRADCVTVNPPLPLDVQAWNRVAGIDAPSYTDPLELDQPSMDAVVVLDSEGPIGSFFAVFDDPERAELYAASLRDAWKRDDDHGAYGACTLPVSGSWSLVFENEPDGES